MRRDELSRKVCAWRARCRASDMWDCLSGRPDKFFRIGWGYDEPSTCAVD